MSWLRTYAAVLALLALAGMAIGWNAAQVVWPTMIAYSRPAADPGPAGAPDFMCPPGTTVIYGACTPQKK